MKRIFTTLFFVAVMSTTVNANVRDFSFPYLESTKTKVASYTTTKKPTKHARAYKKSKRTVMRNKASYASVSTPGARFNAGPRPGKWCGWYLRKLYGGGPEYNRARNWAKRGTPSGPRVGAIVVWKNHVGVIVG